MANVAPIFERIPQTAQSAHIGRVMIVFNLSGDGGGQWTVHVEDVGALSSVWKCTVEPGKTSPKPGTESTAEVMMSTDDFVELSNGKLDVQKAMFDGRVKVSGNPLLSLKLKCLFGPC
jgi:hypothetical protein